MPTDPIGSSSTHEDVSALTIGEARAKLADLSKRHAAAQDALRQANRDMIHADAKHRVASAAAAADAVENKTSQLLAERLIRGEEAVLATGVVLASARDAVVDAKLTLERITADRQALQTVCEWSMRLA